MSTKSTDKTFLQKVGIALFVIAIGVFIASLTMSTFVLDEEALQSSLNDEYHWSFVEKQLDQMRGEEYGSSFTFVPALKSMLKDAQVEIQQDVEENKGLTTSDSEYWNTIMQDYKISSAVFPVTKASSTGFLPNNTWLIFALSILLGIVGAFLYIFPKLRHHPGIKNNHIYHSSMHYRGALGIVTGVYLIGFYVILYFYPEHLVNWVIMMDPLSEAISGNPASQWFLYGFLYTLCILVMGVRMFIKYRHNKYQVIRTASVMFFQTTFAFLIPEILAALNQPYYDFKNIWPLDYDFFFDWQINTFKSAGAMGMFMLFWGIALIFIAVPFLSYFFGKRWYCSWVCGCGGLAETLGDPYRHLSDKSLKAWQGERWIIHGVLVFAVLMTMGVLYTYLPASGGWLTQTTFVWGMSAIFVAATAWLYFTQRNKPNGIPKIAMYAAMGATALIVIFSALSTFTGSADFLLTNSAQVRTWYGFLIGAGFAGVVGTGFYPFMGNRVWCRFGCPLAAYLGLVQKLKSRFRITTNGGQCISCGNCSTYCEMGIDVRWYAQRGQDVVRSSCVGCGICSAVCPRGVLRLENGTEDLNRRTEVQRTIHVSENEISIL